jgi:hypothetical protein
MAQMTPKHILDELREERRRARWSAFWTPFITLASIVVSVGMLMFFARTCRERFPQFTPPNERIPARGRSPSLGPVESSRQESGEKKPVTQDGRRHPGEDQGNKPGD